VLDRLAVELDRVRIDHGNEAIFGGSYGWASAGRFHHAQGQVHRFLNTIGGFVRSLHTYSNGCSATLLPHVVGSAYEVLRRGTTWAEVMDNSELIVAFGGMPLRNTWVSPGGFTRHDGRALSDELGRRRVEIASVSPLRDDTERSDSTRWYPIVPGTDAALMAALAHVIIVESLADQSFLARYCVGVDRFIAYVTGEIDGRPKDPEWAESLCGIPAREIVDLARRMAGHRTMVSVTWSLQRAPHGEQPVWMGIALASLLGQIGLPGGGFAHGYGSMADSGAPWARGGFPALPQGPNPVDLSIPVARVADLFLHPGELYDFDGELHLYPDIRLAYWCGGNPFHHHQDLNRLRRAVRRLDTFVVHEPFWTATARHADVVLPATTTLERNDIGAGRKDSHLIAMHRIADPVGESRHDYDIFVGLARRLGVEREFTEGRQELDWLRNFYDSWRRGLGEAGAGVADFDRFWADGSVEVPVAPGSEHANLFAEFRADPERFALRTPSGRIELFSETIDGFGYDDCPGHPVWLEPPEWLGSSAAARFPLHLIANQPASRLHSQLGHGRVSAASEVAGREPIRLHLTDASSRGISDGDIVRVFNDRGAVLAGAVVSDDVRPGVVHLATGAGYDPLDPSADHPMCVHGNPNVLISDRGTSRLTQGCSGQHALVQIERFDGDPPPVRAHEPPELING